MGNCTSDICNEKERTLIKKAPYKEKIKLDNVDTRTVLPHDYYTGMYSARMADVYDGDTFTVVMNVDEIRGKKDSFRPCSFRIRLMGCDCPELKGATKEAGLKAKAEMLRFIGASGAIGLPLYKKTKEWFAENVVIVMIEFAKRKPNEGEKFGRQLAHLYVKGVSLAEHLIDTGNAKPYQGGTKDQSEWL